MILLKPFTVIFNLNTKGNATYILNQSLIIFFQFRLTNSSFTQSCHSRRHAKIFRNTSFMIGSFHIFSVTMLLRNFIVYITVNGKFFVEMI